MKTKHVILGVIVALLVSITIYQEVKPTAVRQSSKVPDKSSPYVGLSNDRYSLCIKLGSEVMHVMEKSGMNSEKHKASYAKWESQCSLTALWSVAKEQKKWFPSSPKDWADLK
ncbi:hypothetical protein CBP51_19355 [Cellvibrio mixtus]|uniref:Uncharacterized protein n=1 Tax=Cellvibrio mixtus TaxID=39650 RepID=A0A266Q284_9GAMM|nr:hypothetical protein [Cellvibrio mixtus]OZY83952.1 hypothetical protein CBP51_19355 [Cellvibrio mixtus]